MEILPVMRYAKKNLSIILVILIAFMMIAIAIWFFDKRIENIEKSQPVQTAINKKQGIIRS